MSEIDDLTLVRRAKNGDESAFADLVSRHESRVYHHALRLMGNVQDAEEVLQDTFVKVYRKLEGFEERSRFSTWVYRIATNEALMRLRKAKRKKEVFLEDSLGRDGRPLGEEVRDLSRSALDRVLDREIAELLEGALAELPEEYRVVFTMRDIDGLSNADVAEVLDITVAAVKSRLHRSRLYLRDRLSDLLGKRKSAGAGRE